jgi:hypothetical protein
LRFAPGDSVSVLWRSGNSHLDDQRQRIRDLFREPPLSSLRSKEVHLGHSHASLVTGKPQHGYMANNPGILISAKPQIVLASVCFTVHHRLAGLQISLPDMLTDNPEIQIITAPSTPSSTDMPTDDGPSPPLTSPFATQNGQQLQQQSLHQLATSTNAARAHSVSEGKHNAFISIVVPSPTVSRIPTFSAGRCHANAWTSLDFRSPRQPADPVVRSDDWDQRGEHRSPPRARRPLCDSEPRRLSPLIGCLGRDRCPKSHSGG